MDDECDCEKEAEYEIEVFDKTLRQQIGRLKGLGMNAKEAKIAVIDADRERGNLIAYR
jgi:hypothetical protein